MNDANERYSTIVSPEKYDLFCERLPHLRPGQWKLGENFCMMGAVADARSIDDCIYAGWPGWLSNLLPRAYDAGMFGFTKIKWEESNDWAHQLVTAATGPVDYGLAFDQCVEGLLDVIEANPGPYPSRTRFNALRRLRQVMVVWISLSGIRMASEINPVIDYGHRSGLIHEGSGIEFARLLVRELPDHPHVPKALFNLAYRRYPSRIRLDAVREMRRVILESVTSSAMPKALPSQPGQSTGHLPASVLVPAADIWRDGDGISQEKVRQERVRESASS